MTWLASHLSWFVWVLVVVWAPPVLYAIGIDLDIIAAPGSGYPQLSDPALITSALQIAFMIAALPGLSEQRERSWQMLVAALLMWSAHAAWGMLSRLRLDGVRVFRTSETWWPFAGLVIAAVVLVGVRRHFQREGTPALQ